jgi:hypothetical protein
VWHYPDGPRLVQEWIRPGDVRAIAPHRENMCQSRVQIAGRGLLFSAEPVNTIVARVNGAKRRNAA